MLFRSLSSSSSYYYYYYYYYFYYWPVSQDGPPVQLGNKSLTFHPAIGALVVDFSNVTLINYFTFIFEWSSSSSPSLRFTMDYSFDGLHWTAYVEDEQVKVITDAFPFCPDIQIIRCTHICFWTLSSFLPMSFILSGKGK